LRTFRRRRREYPELFKAAKHAHLVDHRLQAPAEAGRFLTELSTPSLQETEKASDHG
jgi:hypothetical protein